MAGKSPVLSLDALDVDMLFRAGLDVVFEREGAGVWLMENSVLVPLDRLVVGDLICKNVLIEVPLWRTPGGGVDKVEVGEDVGLMVRLLAEALTEAIGFCAHGQSSPDGM